MKGPLVLFSGFLFLKFLLSLPRISQAHRHSVFLVFAGTKSLDKIYISLCLLLVSRTELHRHFLLLGGSQDRYCLELCIECVNMCSVNGCAADAVCQCYFVIVVAIVQVTLTPSVLLIIVSCIHLVGMV